MNSMIETFGPDVASEVGLIEDALDALLSVAAAAKPLPNAPEKEPRSLGDILRTHASRTPGQRAIEGLLDNPVGEAVRRAVESLGSRLHEIGGCSLMGEALDRVAVRDPSADDLREAILDHRWSGIGGAGGWMS